MRILELLLAAFFEALAYLLLVHGDCFRQQLQSQRSQDVDSVDAGLDFVTVLLVSPAVLSAPQQGHCVFPGLGLVQETVQLVHVFITLVAIIFFFLLVNLV